MREIKFRGIPTDIDYAKSIGIEVDKDGFVYGSLIVDGSNRWIVGKVVDSDTDYIALEYWIMVIPETVGQYINRNDKNNKEIYEGDILKGTFYHYLPEKNFVFPVCWDTDKAGFQANYFEAKESEIIGNIHDNPELVEK